MSDTRGVYTRLLEKNSNETELFDRAVSLLRSQLQEIVKDPDFGDAVLGMNSIKNKELSQAYQALMKSNLYHYVVNDKNPGTYSPPRLSSWPARG